MIWGESNSRNFLNWAEFCRDKALKERGNVGGNSGGNFTTDRSSSQYNSAKAELLNLIKRNRTISVQQLYNTMPSNLLANPTVKHVILQLFFEDNIQIQGQGSTLSDHETNYALVFLKNSTKTEARPKASGGPRQQSNIEDLIDHDWRATGRKLDFDPKQKPERQNLNISLRRTPRPSVSAPSVKPVIDIKEPIKKEVIHQKPPVITTPKVEEFVENKNVTYIEIPKPKPKNVEVSASFIPDFKPRPVMNKQPVADLQIFYGLSAYELYFIEAFLRDASYKERGNNSIRELRELVKSKADVIYLQNKTRTNMGIKILVALSCLILIGFIFVAKLNKNKVRAKAYKTENKKIKELGYQEFKTKIKAKYPKIIEF